MKKWNRDQIIMLAVAVTWFTTITIIAILFG
jgi:hypothetical protein